MSQFEENLKQLPKAEEVVLLRLFNEKDQLLSLIPTLQEKCCLRVFNKIAGERGLIDSDSAKEGLQWSRICLQGGSASRQAQETRIIDEPQAGTELQG